MTPLQHQLFITVEQAIKLANKSLNKRFSTPKVTFNQRGKIAGSAHLQKWELRFNPILLAENPQAFLQQVVPHELAHLIVFKLFGRVRPHGREWQTIMRTIFNVEPQTTHNFDISSVQSASFIYYCDCSEYPLTIRRHNKVLRGQASYHCRKCKQRLQFKIDSQHKE